MQIEKLIKNVYKYISNGLVIYIIYNNLAVILLGKNILAIFYNINQ